MSASPFTGVRGLAPENRVTLADGSLDGLGRLPGGGTAAAAAVDESLRVGSASIAPVRDGEALQGVRIVTRLGHEILGGPEARLLTIGGPARVGDLGVGDHVAAVRRLPFFGGAAMPDAHVEFLAFMTSDGSLTIPKAAVYYKEDPDLVEAFRRAVGGVGDVRANRVRNSHSYGVARGPGARAAGEANAAVALLERHGLMGKRARERFVPDAIFRLPREQLALYLGRLWSGDGAAYHYYNRKDRKSWQVVRYWSSSRRLCQDFQHLLLRFGVVGRLNRTEGDGQEASGDRDLAGGHWEVVVSEADNVRAFAGAIGPYTLGKRSETLREVVEQLPEVGRPRMDLIPSDVWDLIETARLREGRSKNFVDTGAGVQTRKRQNLSRRRLAAVAGVLGDGQLADLAEGDLFWDRIVAKEAAGEMDVRAVGVAGANVVGVVVGALVAGVGQGRPG